MPTGYTAKIYDGEEQSFREFALTCARAFGATIDQRDESLDNPPRPREPRDYYHKSGEEARALLAEAQGWSAVEAQEKADAQYAKRLADWKESRKHRQELESRYDLMLAHVKAWTPPTGEHEGLKSFMIQQLEEAKKWDCVIYEAPVPLSGKDYREQQIAQAKHRIASADKDWADELARVEGANKWIADLYDSLPEEAQARKAADRG